MTDKSKSIQKRLAAQRGESIEQLVMSTADRLTGETWYNVATKLQEQLAVANETIAAANRLADACRNSGDERIQAALAAFEAMKNGPPTH